MDPTIMVALISLVGTVFGSGAGILVANRLSNYRISQLELQVAKHNNLIDRMYKVETRVTLLEDEIKGKGIFVNEKSNN